MITSIYISAHTYTTQILKLNSILIMSHCGGSQAIRFSFFLSVLKYLWNRLSVYFVVDFFSLAFFYLIFFLFFIHLNQLNTSFSSHRTSHNLCTTCIAYMVNVVSCHLASILILRISLQFIYTKSNRNGIVHIVHQKRLKSTKYIGAIEIWTIATFSFCLVCLFENQLTNSRNKQTELHCAMCISRLYLNLSQSCRVNAIFRCHT